MPNFACSLGELNGLSDIDAADVGNDHLMAFTKESFTSSLVLDLEIVKGAYLPLLRHSMNFELVEPEGMNYLQIHSWTWDYFPAARGRS
jgi:hypothetical protein